MRFLCINHPRLGQSPGGVPSHLTQDSRTFSTRGAWHRAIAYAIQERVHAILLSGEIISAAASKYEPWGPIVDGLAELDRAGIPVVAVPSDRFTAQNLEHFAPDATIHWLDEVLDWDPPFVIDTEPQEGTVVHVVNAELAENRESNSDNVLSLDEVDHDGAIWILTNPIQPDQISTEKALIVEPGTLTPLSAHETNRHGTWLVDTDSREAHLLPTATLEYAAIGIDISSADSLDDLERIISTSLIDTATSARRDGSIAETLMVDVVLVGATRLYASLAEIASDLKRMLILEHDGMSIAIDSISIDATPPIDLEPLLNRPDPVGEVARLLEAIDSGDNFSEAQKRLIAAAEQQILAVRHARVFGAIVDRDPEIDAPTLLRRQGWATLDALVRQRGLDS